MKIQKSKMDPVIARLHRINGQIKAIERMYDGGNGDCIAIVQQVQAARSALGKVAEILLTDEANKCVEKKDMKKFEKIVKRTFKTL